MMHGIPAFTVEEVAQKRANGDDFVLLDVREVHELERATLGEAVMNVPLSEIAMNQLGAFPAEMLADKEAEIVVMCHHGNRSAQVTAWLLRNGFSNVYNMTGGIDAYARQVDASVGRY
jgi:rhodanese-related sulfurtransferase